MNERPLKRIEDARTTLAEIVGEETLQGRRMQAGALLDLMDVAAGRAAFRHSGSAVVTLSFDRVDLVYPIHHQDLIRLNAEVALVGNSSMLVSVRGYRKDPRSREFLPIQRSFVTMVAVDAERRANPNIPGLSYHGPQDEELRDAALHVKSRTAQWQRMQEADRGGEQLKSVEVEEPINRSKPSKRSSRETEVQVRRVFLPRHNNILGTIFGGDILLWMDRVATYTAREFTENPHVVTIAMNRIFFKQPIFTTDVVSLAARVVYVRNFTLEVEIEVELERIDGEVLTSHTGYFTVLSHDPHGVKLPITAGLELDDGDQAGLRRYQQAKHRHEFWKTHQDLS